MNFPCYINESNNDTLLKLLIQPRASKTRIIGEHDGRLKIGITAPPVDGEANAEIVNFLSKKLHLSKQQVQIEVGEMGRRKQVRIIGQTAIKVLQLLEIG